MTQESPERFDRTPNTQQAGWFVDLESAGLLDLDPPYQRRSIWNLEFRQFFMDSVIRNYPTQAMFVEVVVDPDHPTIYRVIDGKQRLTSLMMFLRDEFPTPESLSDVQLGDVYYSDLRGDVKRRILSYKFTVENIQEARPAELNEVFDRLNRNVARLNRQELRHAKYGGEFLTKMEALADDAFWDEVGLVTPARRRRMLDVEYVSEFYVVALSGIQDGKDYLDETYSAYDNEIPNERSTDRLFRAVRGTIEAIHGVLPLDDTRFSNVADFYSLWAAITERLRARTPVDPGAAAEALRLFQDEVNAQSTDRSKSYLLAARQGSNKKSNRELRATALDQVLSTA
jgi:Protein of unknown function DUF262